MADEHRAQPSNDELGNRPIRFGTRHILVLFTVVCVFLAIPGGMYVVGVVVAPWMSLAFIIGPLILLQFLFVLLIPPLRRKLLERHEETS